MFVSTLKCSFLVFIAMTISSSEQFPALSPIPFMVHSICLAPAFTAAKLFATAIPKSSWQCTLNVIFSIFLTFSFKYLNTRSNSSGTVYPTVSGILTVVAPASMAADTTSARYDSSVLEASSGENSISSHILFARDIDETAFLIISSFAIFNLYSL